MSYQRMKMSEMKNALLTMLINKPEQRSYFEWFIMVNENFKQYFHVNHTMFFVYNKSQEKFIPVENKQLSSTESSVIFTKEIIDYSKETLCRYIKQNGYDTIDDFIIFKDEQSMPLGLLLITSTEAWRDFSASPHIEEFKVLLSGFIESIKKLYELVTEEQMFRLLFNITESFTSTMTSATILDQMLQIVENILPTAKTTLILSREQPGMTYTYEIFNQVENNPSIVESFLNGSITSEIKDEDGLIILNAPVKGRQGVYGVLRVEACKDIIYSSTQKRLIYMLVNTTGNALESASLYNQSHRLNEDLKLINETSKELNSGLTLEEMLAYLKKQLEEVLQPNEVLFVLYHENENSELLKTTNPFFETDEGKEYVNDASTYVKEGKGSLFKADFKSVFTEKPVYKSVIGIPILNQEEVIGLVLCLQKERYFFSFDRFKLAEALITHVSLSISNLQLRKKMQELAEKDHLTNLYARRYLEKYVYDIVEKDKGGSFLLFDIDNFKLVNDRYGHDIGDQVLQQIGARLLEIVGDTGIAARWGGEEFAVYLSIYEEEKLKGISEKLLAIIPQVTEPSVTVSMGVVSWAPSIPQNFKQLFKEADQLLYQAKNSGKNQVVLV